MTETERLTAEIREELGCTTVPVDLLSIIEQERIVMAPGDYGTNFNGRIEYLPSEKIFILYYPDDSSGVSKVRIRFTIAHELGHYYLVEHRQLLLAGAVSDCAMGFTSENEREHEADEFASCLLVPPKYLEQAMGSKRFMDLSAVVRMADDLQVSVPAAVIRYVHYAEEKCGVVLSQSGKVKYYVSSEEMGNIGFKTMPREKSVPSSSKARQLLLSQTPRQCEGKLSSTSEWFYDRSTNLDLWEDSFSLGYSDQVITLLSIRRKADR